MNGGSYTIATPLTVSTGASFDASATTSLTSSITASGVYSGSLFLATEPTEIDSGTLASTPSIGSTTISANFTTTVPSVGQFIRLCHSDSSQVFQIANKSGAGPYTLTLDRPVKVPFVSSDSLFCYASVVEDATIDGKGMVVGGTGDLYAELFACQRCRIQNVRVASSLGALRANTFCMSFDIGGYKNAFRNLYIEGASANVGFSGPVHEAGEDGLTEDVTCQNMTGNGPAFVDSVDCVMNRCFTKNATSGFAHGFGSQPVANVASLGCFACVSNDCVAENALYGFEDNASEDSRVNRYKAYGCGTGLWATTSSNGLIVSGLSTTNSTTQGVYIQSQGAKGTIIRDWTANEQNGNSNGATVASGSSAVLFDGFGVKTGGGSFSGCGFDLSGNRTTLRNGVISVATGSRIAVIVRAGTTILENVQVTTGSSVVNGVYCSGSSGTVYIDRRCDFSQCESSGGTAVTLAAGFTVVVEQGGVYATTGSPTLTFTQLQNAELEISGTAGAGNVTVTSTPALIPGMEWTCRNNNTTTGTTKFFGITVANGKSAKIRVNSAGTAERVSPDT